MPTDYRHIDKHVRLVMTLIALCCTRQSRVETDGQTDRPSTLSPSFAVDKNNSSLKTPFQIQIQQQQQHHILKPSNNTVLTESKLTSRKMLITLTYYGQ